MDLNEQDLISRAKRGENGAVGSLWRKYDPVIRKACRRHMSTLNIPLAHTDDVTQEVGVRFRDIIAKFDPTRGAAFSTFIFDQVRGVATEFKRTLPRSSFSIFDKGKLDRSGDYVPPPKAAHRDFGRPISDYWPDGAKSFVKNLRGNSRRIADALWLQHPPVTESEIARQIGMARQSVADHRKTIERKLEARFGSLNFGGHTVEIKSSADELDDEYEDLKDAGSESGFGFDATDLR